MSLNYSKYFLAGSLAFIIVMGFGNPSFAGAANTTKIIHLGFLQIAAHDFFDMNRISEIENENGKLDLSTVLFNPKAGLCDFKKSLHQEDGCALYDEITISNGGEKRNVENIMISTASAEVGQKYLQLVGIYGEKTAYQKTLQFYHEQIKIAYEETFNLSFPTAREGQVNNLHNLAVRSVHDFLPAKIMFNDQMTSIFMIPPLEEKLDELEKIQPSSPLDGKFDTEFTGINFCPIPVVFCIVVDLLDADKTFGDQFGMDPGKFDDFMVELGDGQFNESEEISKLIDEAFAMGLSFDNSDSYPVAGKLLTLDSSALLIAGFVNSLWMVPTILGITCAGIYMAKIRKNQN